jgi:hypothetical protein
LKCNLKQPLFENPAYFSSPNHAKKKMILHQGISNTHIHALLKNETWIDLDSITFQDGRVLLLYVDFGAEPNHQIRSIADTTIESCIKHSNDSFTPIDIYDTYSDSIVEIFVGPGTFEEEGYVLLKDSQTHDLKWLAFFCSSSPFKKILEVRLDKLVIQSEDGAITEFDVNTGMSMLISTGH